MRPALVAITTSSAYGCSASLSSCSAVSGPVGVGGVEEGDPELDGPAQHGQRGVVVLGRPPHALAGQLHGAVAEAYDGQVAADARRCRTGWR